MSAGADGSGFISTTGAAIFDEAQSQRVESGDGKARAPRHRGPQAPVGRRSGAGCAVGGKMRLPRLDVVLGSGAPAVGILVERLGLGDDEAGIGTLGADLDPRDSALDAAPTGGAVNELLEAEAREQPYVLAGRGAHFMRRGGIVGLREPRPRNWPASSRPRTGSVMRQVKVPKGLGATTGHTSAALGPQKAALSIGPPQAIDIRRRSLLHGLRSARFLLGRIGGSGRPTLGGRGVF